jgi:HSP20 family protein
MCHSHAGQSGCHSHAHRHHGKFAGFGFAAQRFARVPINIQTNEDGYTLHVYAPGLSKSDFKLAIKDNLLTISYQKAAQNSENAWKRQEFDLPSFERTFALDKDIVVENIKAAYIDGVLQVNLPLSEDAKRPAQDIPVA